MYDVRCTMYVSINFLPISGIELFLLKIQFNSSKIEYSSNSLTVVHRPNCAMYDVRCTLALILCQFRVSNYSYLKFNSTPRKSNTPQIARLAYIVHLTSYIS